MFIHLRRTLVYFTKDSPFLGKSNASIPLYFSTYGGNQRTNPSGPELWKRKYNLKNPANPSSVISFLKDNGFSEIQVNKIIESRPVLLAVDLEKTIKPKFKTFKEIGFSESQIIEIISKEPWVLKRSLNNKVIPTLSLLTSLFGSSTEVAKLLTTCGWFMSCNLEKTLVPNIKFLASVGVPMKQIIKGIYGSPRFFLVNPDILKKGVEKAEELGAVRSSKMFLIVVKVLTSMKEETWELKLQAFRNMGFSDEDILSVFKRAPQVFSVSEEKMKKVKDVLLATGKYDLSCILSSPSAFTASIEKRYKPRLQVLEILESKNLIKKWPNLSTVHIYSNQKFFKYFVEPYLQNLSEVEVYKVSELMNC